MVYFCGKVGIQNRREVRREQEKRKTAAWVKFFLLVFKHFVTLGWVLAAEKFDQGEQNNYSTLHTKKKPYPRHGRFFTVYPRLAIL